MIHLCTINLTLIHLTVCRIKLSLQFRNSHLLALRTRTHLDLDHQLYLELK